MIVLPSADPAPHQIDWKNENADPLEATDCSSHVEEMPGSAMAT